MYAVYEFLERFLGCSFAAYAGSSLDAGEIVPKTGTIILSDIFYTKPHGDGLEFIDGTKEAIVRYIAAWITGHEPTFIPAPILHYGTTTPLPFETARRGAVSRGIRFIGSMLVNGGRGGAKEGLSHAIDKNGVQAPADCIRTDCTGECAGALRLYAAVTGRETHKAFLYLVANDLQKSRHKCGGYCKWDTGCKATRSRKSTTGCSLLTENGDPVADMLYSSNWLPLGFALAFRATGDVFFKKLWQDSVAFCINTQIVSVDKRIDGSWCRAFDMDRWEAYACPHDVGWAACASESGWTDAEILMGMMLPSLWEE